MCGAGERPCGAARDLVTPGLTGSIFPFGNMDAFVNELRTLLKAPERVKQMGGAARKRMETWSTKQTIDGPGSATTLCAAAGDFGGSSLNSVGVFLATVACR